MKKLLFKSLMVMGAMLAVVTGFTSCSSGGDDEPTPTLSVSTSSISVEASGGSMNLQVMSNTGWYVSSGASWCSVSPQQGNNNGVVYVTASENTSTNSRSCTLTVSTTDGSLMQNVQISQSGLQASLEATPSVSLTSEKGASNTFSITSNVSWTLSGVPEWLKADPLNGDGNKTVTLTTLNANETAEERTATLTVTAGGQTASIKVTQASMYANCSASVANELILSNGYYADLEFSSNVLGYVSYIIESSLEKTYGSKELYDAVLSTGERKSASDNDYAMWNGLSANTSYAYCIIPYISSEGGNVECGPMTITHFTSKSNNTYCDAPVTTSYTTSKWKYTTTMNKRCQHYWLLYATGSGAYNYHSMPDIYLAYSIRYRIENNENYDYSINERSVSIDRESGDNYFFVWTWGVDDNGDFSGNISTSYKRVSSSVAKANNKAKAPYSVETGGRKKMNDMAKSLVIKEIKQ